MKYLDSLLRRFTPGGTRARKIELIETGDRLEKLVQEGHFQTLLDLVMDPMEKEAFEQYQSMDPTDFSAVMQNQKIGQVIREIKRRVSAKIRDGYIAREDIKQENESMEEMT